MRNGRTRAFLGILLTMALVISFVVGCGNNGGGVVGDVENEQGNQDNQDNQDENNDNDNGAVGEEDSEPVPISYWAATSPESSETDPKNMEVFKIVEEKTNVSIEWEHIPEGTEGEQFKLMVLSDKLPDVIFYKWQGDYGPDKAIEDDIIIPLNDIISEHAPNYSKLISENEELDKLLKSDGGDYFCFPKIRGTEMWDRLINGLQMRKDWLDDLDLEAPETIDDWYTTLKAFKDQKGAEIPFGIKMDRLGLITSAWGFDMTNFIIDGDKFVYAPIEPEFKEVLETLRKWSDEGLLVMEYEDLAKEVIAGEVGAWQDTPGRYVEEGQESNPNFDVIGVKNPVLEEGNTPFIFPRLPFEGNRGAAISAQCPEEKYEAIARWLDFSYSEEGQILDHFGIEGEQYTIEDGKIMPMDIMYESEPDGLSSALQYAMRHFRPKNAPGPYMDGGEQEFLHEDAKKKDPIYPYKKQAIDAWGDGDPSRVLPPLNLTSEETEEMEDYSEMWEYVSNKIREFISGEESLDNFDEYVKEAKRLGADGIVDIYQAALDRYNSR